MELNFSLRLSATIHDSNDGQRNTGSDQTVFNGGGTNSFFSETRKKLGHLNP